MVLVCIGFYEWGRSPGFMLEPLQWNTAAIPFKILTRRSAASRNLPNVGAGSKLDFLPEQN
jgi:hypothetical protein